MKISKNNLPSKSKLSTWPLFVLTMVVFGLLYINSITPIVDITEQRFEEMMLQEDVKKVTFILGVNVVDVIVHETAFSKEPYKTELEKKSIVNLISNKQPHYRFLVPSGKIFNDNFKAIEAKLPPEKRIGYTTEIYRFDCFYF